MIAVGVFTLRCTADSPSPPRNLLVICLDTFRLDRIGQRLTPRIDRLAATGASYVEARSTSSWTVPAVASLFTGLYPERHGAGLTGDPRNLDDTVPAQPSPDVESLAGRLTENGFETALISANPFLYGWFQREFGLARIERRPAESLIDDALDWLRDRRGARWFLYLQLMDAHHPNEPPARYARQIDSRLEESSIRRFGGWDHARQDDFEDSAFQSFRELRVATYDATVRYLDDEVGRLLDALDRLGLSSDTLVVLTADHGEEFWDHASTDARFPEDPRGIWGIGHGHTLYDELLRVPLIFAGPGAPRVGRSRCPASLVDLAPTVLEALGLPPLPNVDGIDLSANGECGERPLFATSLAYGRDFSTALYGRWKLIHHPDFPPRLFDLAGDSSEHSNVAGARPEVVELLRRRLDENRSRWREGSPAAPYDDPTREQLRALGYL